MEIPIMVRIRGSDPLWGLVAGETSLATEPGSPKVYIYLEGVQSIVDRTRLFTMTYLDFTDALNAVLDHEIYHWPGLTWSENGARRFERAGAEARSV